MNLRKRLPTFVQVFGGLAVVAGVYLIAGLAIALLVAGAVLLALGYLYEDGQ